MNEIIDIFNNNEFQNLGAQSILDTSINSDSESEGFLNE